MLVTQSCLTLCDPVDCSPPGSSIHGLLQAGILEWVACPFSRGSSWPRNWTWVSCIAGGFFTVWATRERVSLTSVINKATAYMHLLCILSYTWRILLSINYCGLGWLFPTWGLNCPFSCFSHGHWAPGSSLPEAGRRACRQQGHAVMPVAATEATVGKKGSKCNWWVSFNSFLVSWVTPRVCSERTMPRWVFLYFLTG